MIVTPTTTERPRGELLGLALQTRPPQGIATRIFQPLATMKKSGVWWKAPLRTQIDNPKIERAPGSTYARTTTKLESDTYACQEYGHEEFYDDSQAAEYGDVLDYETVLVTRGYNVVTLAQEIRAAALIHNTSTFALSGNTGLSVTNEWDDAANATPIDDIQAAREGIRARCGLSPTSIQISWKAWFDLWKVDSLLNRIKYVVRADTPQPGNADAERALAQILGLDEVIVADPFYLTSAEGQTDAIGDVYSDEYAFVFVRSRNPADMSEPCLGRTFHWDQDGGLMLAEEYYSSERRGRVFRVRQSVQQKISQTACGFLLGNVAAN